MTPTKAQQKRRLNCLDEVFFHGVSKKDLGITDPKRVEDNSCSSQ